MSIDLSVLLSGGSTSSATMSPLAMYKKLQKTAEENEGLNASTSEAEKIKETLRQFNNAAIRLRNAQYREENVRVENDVTYYKNRVATATTVAELINDDRFLKVLAEANGYQELYRSDKQKLRDILTSDPNDANSVARQGSLQDLELAKKYNFGATGLQLDVNGDAVGLDVDNKVTNVAADIVTNLPAGLAKLRGLNININGAANVITGSSTPSDNGKLQGGINVVAADTSTYSVKLSRALQDEQGAPTSTGKTYYEFDGADYQKFLERSDVQAEADYYRNNIGNVETLDDLFGDYRMLKFVLSAYDLESDIQFPGKIRKIIESDLTDVNSLANRFQDARYQQLAKDITFVPLGLTRLKLGSTTDEMVKKYQQVEYERNLDEQAPGVRAAIEFGRRIKDVTLTAQLLGDSVLREVITVANNLPQEIAYQSVEAQVTAVERKVDVNSLKNDQNEIDKMVTRYLTFKDGGGTGSSQSYLLNLFG